MATKNPSEHALFTPANVVTLVRIILVPVFVVAFISPWPEYFPDWPQAESLKPWIAALLFVILASTDAVDGYLARSRGEVTTFGKFIDPLADKILVAAALLALVELQLLPSWVALVIIVREFIVSGLRMLAADRGVVIAASWYGKAKTVFQIIAIVLFIIKGSDVLLSLHPAMEAVLYFVSWFFMLVAVALTLISMLDYFVKAKEILEFGSPRNTSELQDVSDGSVHPLESTQGGHEQDSSYARAQEVVELARKKGWLISTAESCTGGLICGALTAVPGSSDVVAGGIVSYSNEVKHAVLGVSDRDLSQHGAVSEPVACQMAEGSRRCLSTQLAVSVTGIAGPGGATSTKPVGTVWFGVSGPQGTFAELRHFNGNRKQVREQTVMHALDLLKKQIV